MPILRFPDRYVMKNHVGAHESSPPHICPECFPDIVSISGPTLEFWEKHYEPIHLPPTQLPPCASDGSRRPRAQADTDEEATAFDACFWDDEKERIAVVQATTRAVTLAQLSEADREHHIKGGRRPLNILQCSQYSQQTDSLLACMAYLIQSAHPDR